tara:strand:+ start:99 stop:260 length:162 start_codon:yes stop_codon:yes gene_type:complete
MSKVYDYYMDRQKACPHNRTEYIPPEPEINVSEALVCEDCGIDLPLQKPEDIF